MNPVRDCYAIFNLLPVPLAVHDELGNITFFNKAFEDTFGYTTTDIPTLEAWWPAAYPDPAYRQSLATLWQQFIEEAKRSGKPFRPIEANVRCKDGSARTVFCSAAPMEGQPGYHLAILHDITEKKRAEQESRMARISVEAAADAIFWVTPDARIVDVNQAACDFLGYTREEFLQMGVSDIDPYYDGAVWAQHFQELRETGGAKVESLQRSKDGRLLPVEVSANYVRLGEQELNCAFCRDIAERKQMEETLRESEYRFRSFMDNAPAVAWMKDDQFRMVYLSVAYEKQVSIPAAEILGKSDFEVWPQATAEAFRKNDEIVLNSNQVLEGVEETILPDGQRRYWAISKFPFEDAAGRRYIGGMGVDITRRKQAQEALLLKNLVFDQSIAANSISDREGVLTEVNKAFVRIWGYESQSEVIGKPIPHFLSDPAVAEEIVAQLVSSDQWEGDFSGKRKDGSSFAAHGLATVVRDELGEIVGFQSSVVDVSERKRAETLLEEAKDTAEAANRAKSQFLANMSHEIRTPITAIIGFAELLEDTELAELQKKYLRAIANSSENLMSIVNEILDLSRIETGRVKLAKKSFDIRKIVDEIIESQVCAAKNKKLSLDKTIAADVPNKLIGDPVRVKQILLNVVNNAIKFTHNGQVRLAVAVEERQPSVTLLRIDIADTGIGIQQEDLLKIFKPFSQVDTSSTRDHGGIGLGLAICSMLATLLEGEIWVDSQFGVGSTFHVRLPFLVSDLATASTDSQEIATRPAWEGRLQRVLLVEDNDTSQLLFSEMLKTHGHSCDLAKNGAEALGKWRKDLYDVILMDLQMPVMDGFEAVQRIRASEEQHGGHVPIIALTAHAMENYRIDILKKGFDGYVTKPTTGKVLFTEIKRCLAK